MLSKKKRKSISNRKYYLLNREKLIADMKIYKLNHKVEQREYNRSYYLIHKKA
jgi:hypothetical protein